MFFPIVKVWFSLHDLYMEMEKFRKLVESFLKKTGMAATSYGRNALGDPGFVARLRKGARCWPETQEKCIKFMASFKATQSETDAA